MLRLAACLFCLATPTSAQDSAGAAAQAAADRLEAASVQLSKAGGARDRVRALTATVRAYEDGLAAMRDGLRRAAIREQTLRATLDAKSTEVGQLLGVLQATGQTSGPLSLLHPNGALGTARAGMIAADVTPALQAEVNTLRAQLEEVALLRSLQESAAETLEQGLAGAQEARSALSEAISDRTDLPRRFTDDPIQTALLIASTETLDGFASGLTDAFLNQPGGTDARAAKGSLALPVQGQVLRGFNAADAAGITRPGVILATRPRALVTTPVPATLLFQGPLLEYGNVVIVEPAPDVLFVFGGLAEVYGTVGQVLPADAPIGLMGGEAPSVNVILTENDATTPTAASETLYLEVREGQSPVDPATWFVLD
ncbi:Septal ring factor EnvC, activator of murein hydrolases AmiA and AmiB [Cognatiyoonia koreensis]|uniref:Septal ring factor EnvC, activator of murein hydrolases AmiA and AmiB n=1 Tax=Cognatiyoonia koreensis TaxID=364200 RepID=A0A1I0RX08_9RHOB|nr:peptidase M23 [Cognatiyoonia koreensis]SEW45958.1 Septal ring factor EnvC, activator of murein hydrolases AmiA and AmiB [Cognatiyoonia koreensis]